LFERI